MHVFSLASHTTRYQQGVCQNSLPKAFEASSLALREVSASQPDK